MGDLARFYMSQALESPELKRRFWMVVDRLAALGDRPRRASDEGHRGLPRLVACGRQAVWDLGAQPGSAAGWALEREPAVERLDTVGEPAQAGPLVVGAADAVVGDGDPEVAGVGDGAHNDTVGAGVLVHVGERLGDDVVGGRLD